MVRAKVAADVDLPLPRGPHDQDRWKRGQQVLADEALHNARITVRHTSETTRDILDCGDFGINSMKISELNLRILQALNYGV